MNLKQYPKYAGKTDYYIKKELGVSGNLATVSTMKKVLAELIAHEVTEKNKTDRVKHEKLTNKEAIFQVEKSKGIESVNMKICKKDDISKNIMVVLIWSREQYDINETSAVPGSQTSSLAKLGFKYIKQKYPRCSYNKIKKTS